MQLYQPSRFHSVRGGTQVRVRCSSHGVAIDERLGQQEWLCYLTSYEQHRAARDRLECLTASRGPTASTLARLRQEHGTTVRRKPCLIARLQAQRPATRLKPGFAVVFELCSDHDPAARPLVLPVSAFQASDRPSLPADCTNFRSRNKNIDSTVIGNLNWYLRIVYTVAALRRGV